MADLLPTDSPGPIIPIQQPAPFPPCTMHSSIGPLNASNYFTGDFKIARPVPFSSRRFDLAPTISVVFPPPSFRRFDPLPPPPRRLSSPFDLLLVPKKKRLFLSWVFLLFGVYHIDGWDRIGNNCFLVSSFPFVRFHLFLSVSALFPFFFPFFPWGFIPLRSRLIDFAVTLLPLAFFVTGFLLAYGTSFRLVPLNSTQQAPCRRRPGS